VHVAVVPELTGRRLHRELAALGYRGGVSKVLAHEVLLSAGAVEVVVSRNHLI